MCFHMIASLYGSRKYCFHHVQMSEVAGYPVQSLVDRRMARFLLALARREDEGAENRTSCPEHGGTRTALFKPSIAKEQGCKSASLCHTRIFGQVHDEGGPFYGQAADFDDSAVGFNDTSHQRQSQPPSCFRTTLGRVSAAK